MKEMKKQLGQHLPQEDETVEEHVLEQIDPDTNQMKRNDEWTTTETMQQGEAPIDESRQQQQQVVYDEADETAETNRTRRKRKRKRKRKNDSISNGDEDDDNKEARDNKMINEGTAVNQISHDNDDDKVQQLDRTVFIEGIPYDCTKDEVVDLLMQHLATKASNDSIEGLIQDIRLPTWQDTGRLRGYGHVVFVTRKQQQAALELSSHEKKPLYLHQRYLTIRPAKAPQHEQLGPSRPSTSAQQQQPSSTLVIHNLSYQATEDDLAAALQPYLGSSSSNKNKNNPPLAPGAIRVVRHPVPPHASKGFAYVDVSSVQVAQNLMQALSSSSSSSLSSSSSGAAPTLTILGRTCRLDYDHGRIRGSFRTAQGRLWQKEYSAPTSSRTNTLPNSDTNSMQGAGCNAKRR